MKLILLLLSGLSAQDYIPPQYHIDAIAYYRALSAQQWNDVWDHVATHGIANSVFAGLEGSNRPGIRHRGADYQDTGVSLSTARLYYSWVPDPTLRALILDHDRAATLSARIHTDNLFLEYTRGSKRPELNAAMRYRGGKEWRAFIRYGLAFMARYSELEKRMIIREYGVKF